VYKVGLFPSPGFAWDSWTAQTAKEAMMAGRSCDQSCEGFCSSGFSQWDHRLVPLVPPGQDRGASKGSGTPRLEDTQSALRPCARSKFPRVLSFFPRSFGSGTPRRGCPASLSIVRIHPQGIDAWMWVQLVLQCVKQSPKVNVAEGELELWRVLLLWIRVQKALGLSLQLWGGEEFI